MEIVLDYKNVYGMLLRYPSIELNQLLKCRDSAPKDSSLYVPVIPNIYCSNPKYCEYIGKGKYNEKLNGWPYANIRALNHRNDALSDAIQKVGPENIHTNILVGISDEEARACEALLLYLDDRCGLEYGQKRWEGEPLLNKRNEDVDMKLIDKYFDLDGNNYIETFRRKMYRY